MIRHAVVVAAVLACAGCSDAPSGRSSADEADRGGSSAETPPNRANGPTITGSSYHYNVPEGWGEPPQSVPGFDPDSLAVDLEDDDGFADNINVIPSPAGKLTPEEAEDAAEAELTASGVEHFSIRDRVTVAGDESAHTTADFSINALKYTADQFYLTNDDQTYVVTFSFSLDVTSSERAEITDAVLASWVWED